MSSPVLLRKSVITRTILRWYRRHGRSLPWRNVRDPYKVLLSEIMLQQTQVSRVLEIFPRFVRKFPTFASLARARTSSVVRAWRGMGYNNRAVRLRQIARSVVREFHGTLPSDTATLETLPGIGKYTSHALSSFVGNAHVPVVDTNVRRVLSRLYPRESRLLDEWTLAARILPRGRAYDWNQALMDFGALVCTAVPKCSDCPLSAHCPSAFSPRRNPAPRISRETGRRGIPNRLYRGKIVDALRTAPHVAGLTGAELGRRVLPGFGKRDAAWLRTLVDALERDGLISRRRWGRGFRVSLAD